jgi:hypothetical protein
MTNPTDAEKLRKLADAFASEDDGLNPWSDPQAAAHDLYMIADRLEVLDKAFEEGRLVWHE